MSSSNTTLIRNGYHYRFNHVQAIVVMGLIVAGLNWANLHPLAMIQAYVHSDWYTGESFMMHVNRITSDVWFYVEYWKIIPVKTVDWHIAMHYVYYASYWLIPAEVLGWALYRVSVTKWLLYNSVIFACLIFAMHAQGVADTADGITERQRYL